MLKIKSAKKNEKGIALIFTLIMLSLLMILALSFALDSMFEQKAAYNSASSSSSGFMAQAQLKQVLLLLKEGQANFDSDGYLYSHDSGSATDTDMLVSRLPVAGVLAADDVVLDPDSNPNTDDPKVNWNYIRSGPLATDPIIGRTAFVVVPEDKIPLDSLLDDRAVSATLSASCLYPKHNEKDDTETRIGKYVSEINVRAAIPAVTTNISTITETLNWSGDSTDANRGFTDGEYNGSWLSFNSLFSTINTAISPDNLSDDDKTEFESKLTLTVANDEEAFWVDLDTDKSVGSNEIYNRFDLTRGDWSTSTTHADDMTFIKNVILLDADGDGEPDIDMDAWNGNDSLDDFSVPATLANYSKGLPWLACFGYDIAGAVSDTSLGKTFGATVAGVTARRYQIAANLKDYSDSDDRPTSDVDPNILNTPSWLTQVPAYTGNEKTPYINKIGVHVKAIVQADEFVSNHFNVNALLEMKAYVELINIYDTSWTSDLKVAVKVTIKLTGDVNGVSVTIPDQIKTCYITVGSGTWDNAGYSNFAYQSSGFTYTTTPDQLVSMTTPEMTVKVEDVIIDKAILYNSSTGDAYDYTNTLSSTSGSVNVCVDAAGGDTGEAWYGWAVHDPRQNLNSGDWLELTHAQTTDPSTIFSFDTSEAPAKYKGKTNFLGPVPTDDPSAGDGITADKETVTDPAYISSTSKISTAYIRNAPMESPWELGFIHRGAKWETINLKKYDKTKAFQKATTQITTGKDYIPGGGAYTDGDANILDQIKMTAKAESPQKIKLSSIANANFNALFSKIKLGCDIDSALTVKSIAGLDTTTTGEEISLVGAYYTTMRTAIMAQFASPDTINLTNLTRASIACLLTNCTDNILVSADDTEPPTISLGAAVTDAAQEELIGKIVNLTKVGKQSGDFTIIVLSQTINDIGGPGTTITVYKVPADGSDALPVDCEIGSFDVTPASPATATWTDDAYGDEITGEQKIMVKINNSASNIITIKSFQYID